jgi:hypothetical protein
MKLLVKFLMVLAVIGASLISTPVIADQTVTCKSKSHQYRMCRVDTHGYVRLKREHSRKRCVQGRTWDYDRRGIWVDDNCAADFVVESRNHSSSDNSNSGNALAAVAAVALIATVASSASKNKHDDRYHDEDYGHGGNSSYVPGWMIGRFKGYNMQYGSEVELSISEDGRVRANVEGTRLSGYVNDERLYVGDAEFHIERAGEGFMTIQAGNRSNKVHYSRDN